MQKNKEKFKQKWKQTPRRVIKMTKQIQCEALNSNIYTYMALFVSYIINIYCILVSYLRIIKVICIKRGIGLQYNYNFY